MRKAWSYLPWSKVAGSSLLLGVPAYIWAYWLGLSQYAGTHGPSVLLAASLALPFPLLIWADRSAASPALRKAYVALTGLCIGSVVLPAFLGLYAPALQGWGVLVLALAVACLIWQRDTSPPAWQRKVLWAFVAAAVPSVAGGIRAFPGTSSLLSLALLMSLGIALCLTGNDEDLPGRYSARRVALMAILLSVTGWLALVLVPGASTVASYGIRGILEVLRALILAIVKPWSILVGWLMDALLAAIGKRGQETESPLNPIGPPERPELEEDLPPSEIWPVVGWALAFMLIILALWAIWKLLEMYSSRARGEGADEVRSSDFTASKAARWALDKVKELGRPLASMISRRLRLGSEDPLVAMYERFLTLAYAAGYVRAPSQTPIEFAHFLEEKLPDAAPYIESITTVFSSRFYSGRQATHEELAKVRESLAAFEASLAGKEES